MDKLRITYACLRNNVEGIMMKEDRYYVQRLTEQVFLIRERLSANGAQGPDDRIVRSFDVRHDAYAYADSVNEKQRKLDEDNDQREQRAI
jgi:hypothetical protein